MSDEQAFGAPDKKDEGLRDEALSAEIQLLGHVIAAVSDEGTSLSEDQLDSVLGVGSEEEAGSGSPDAD